MTILTYDGTFTGLLTCIFEVYEQRLIIVHICREGAQQGDAFSDRFTVLSEKAKADRVWQGLEKKLSAGACYRFFSSYLSEMTGIEDLLLAYARYIFAAGGDAENDYGHPAVLQVTQTAKKVAREKHRMEAFVRFQLLKDGIYYSGIEPDFNVLPLITKHFKSRYASQDWLIYDIKRRYGIHYSQATGATSEITIAWNEGTSAAAPASDLFEPKEELYQLLWKDYFKHTGIPARKNMKLHIQHVPRRYWKYLTEKQ